MIKIDQKWWLGVNPRRVLNASLLALTVLLSFSVKAEEVT